MLRTFQALLFVILLFACQSNDVPIQTAGGDASIAPVQVQHWGGMRDVLRNGNTQGRVQLSDVVGPNSFAVGALEGLAAEITVLAGEVHLAEVEQVNGQGEYNVRSPKAGEQATLFVFSTSPTLDEYVMPLASDLATFEASIRSIAAASVYDVTQPFPFRVEGTVNEVHLHVLNHSCPIANPDGPAPWRHTAQNQPTNLIGFYAQDAAGLLTHHGQSTHIHAQLPTQNISGHVDALSFTHSTSLFLPVR